MDLSTEQAARLREYVMRGGFMFLDDFWGEYEWENVQEQFQKIVPEYRPKTCRYAIQSSIRIST